MSFNNIVFRPCGYLTQKQHIHRECCCIASVSPSMFVLGIQLSSAYHIIKQTAMHTLLFKKTLCISLKKSFCKWFQLYQQSHLTHSILHALKIKSGLKLRLFKLLTLMNTIQVYRIKV